MRAIEELICANFVNDLGIKTILVEDLDKFQAEMDDSIYVERKGNILILESDGGRIAVREGK